MLRYKVVLRHAIFNFQAELVEALKQSKSSASTDYCFLESKLKVIQGRTIMRFFSEKHRSYTVPVFSPPRKVYYIALT